MGYHLLNERRIKRRSKINNAHKVLERVDEEEFYDDDPLKLDNGLRDIEKRLLNKIKNKGKKDSVDSSPFVKTKFSMPHISTKEKFYSTRSTSSSSMLHFITQSSINSSNSQFVRSPEITNTEPGLVRQNRYGNYDIKSLRRNIAREMNGEY